jgi:holo-[acyl-carrier protein] synthase
MRIGVDVIEIERIAHALRRFPGFARRILTEGERAQADGRRDPVAFVAGRFAAKEAVAKALGGRFSWQEVEIVPGRDGAPGVVLHGRAEEAGEGLEVCLTISHSRTVAAAVAVATATADS